MGHEDCNTTPQAAAGGDDTEQLLDDVRLRLDLKPSDVKVLTALLQAGPDRWRFSGPVSEVAAIAGLSDKTVRVCLRKLRDCGLVTEHATQKSGVAKEYHVREGVMRGDEQPFDTTTQTTFHEPADVERTAVEAAADDGPTAVDFDAAPGYRGSDSGPDSGGYRGNSTAVAAAPVSVRGQSQSPSVGIPSVSVSVHAGVAENFHARRDRLPWQRERFTDADLQTLDRRMLATLFGESVRQGHLDSGQAIEFYAAAFHCATHPGIPERKRAKYFTGRVRKHNFRGLVDAAWDWAKQVVRDPAFEGAPKTPTEQRAELEAFRDSRDAASPRTNVKPGDAGFDARHQYAIETLAAMEGAEAERGRPP